MCVHICLCWHAHVCVSHGVGAQEEKAGIRSPGSGIIDSYEVDGSAVKRLSVLAENLSSVVRIGK